MLISEKLRIEIAIFTACCIVLMTACSGKSDFSTTPAVDQCKVPSVSNKDYGPATDLSEFESQLEHMRIDLQIPGMSAGIANRNAVVWSKGFGLSNVQLGVQATVETSYRLASLTKTFASTIIMQLVEDGNLDLDTPVSHFGITLANAENITVRHLMTHTSEGEPGSYYSYNGARFAQLDHVISTVTGSSFAELLRQNIIEPLQLTQTAPCTSPEANNLDLAQGYCPSGEDTEAYVHDFSCSAGLISSVPDYLRYSIAIDEHQFLSAETQEEIFSPAVANDGHRLPYGLGWFVQYIQGTKVLWHYGYWYATSTLIIKVPERQLAFVIMANTAMLSHPFGLGQGDVTRSFVARNFLDSFVFGDGNLTTSELE